MAGGCLDVMRYAIDPLRAVTWGVTRTWRSREGGRRHIAAIVTPLTC